VPTFIEGNHDAGDARFAVVVSRFNALITERLLEGALDTLRRHGADLEGDDVTVVRCPGAFESPLVVKRLAEQGEHDAVLCLGAVVRGDTPHFEYVAGEAASGLTRAALDTDTPVVFGVLTTDTVEQALERAGSKAGNKGSEAAEAAIEMVDLMRTL